MQLAFYLIWAMCYKFVVHSQLNLVVLFGQETYLSKLNLVVIEQLVQLYATSENLTNGPTTAGTLFGQETYLSQLK